MRVRFVSGPHAGEARHCERNWIIDLLVDAGILEHCPYLVDSVPPVPVQKQPTWSVGTFDISGRHYIQYVSPGGEVMNFDGHPDRTISCFKRSHVDVPENVLAEYRRLTAPRLDPETVREREYQERLRMESAQKYQGQTPQQHLPEAK